jgi:anaerobic sulfite reductase subunit B
MENIYLPFVGKIISITEHTNIDYTFRMEYDGNVKPGQFFEVSVPKYGEAPISVCGIGDGYVDLTIRRVGVVTDVIHTFFPGDTLFMRGPYGNGFDISLYRNKEIIVAVGGTGLAPVKGIVDYYAAHRDESKNFNLLMGFKSPDDVLFKDDIKKWSKTVAVTLTVDKAEEGYTGNTGLITNYVKALNIESVAEAQVIIVGPPIMLKFTVAEFINKGVREENIWVSYERKMCCGVGKCGHCKMDDTYICLEGPVFNYTKAKNLVD